MAEGADSGNISWVSHPWVSLGDRLAAQGVANGSPTVVSLLVNFRAKFPALLNGDVVVIVSAISSPSHPFVDPGTTKLEDSVTASPCLAARFVKLVDTADPWAGRTP